MKWLLLFACIALPWFTAAQENYEIQVYGSQTVPRGNTMLELHSNFTFGGQTATVDGVLPTHNVLHETIEITRGFTSWFETGFYFFNAIGSDDRTNYVGSHVRPRIMIPGNWHWPVGVSLSAEFGYQRPEYCADDWTLEIRPIVDKTWKRLYVAFNPVFERSLHGMDAGQGFVFSPNLKAGYGVTKQVALGFEYYGSVGRMTSFDPIRQQQHQLFFVTDIEWSQYWEFNAGYGLGFTDKTDGNILKVILGYKLHKRKAN